MSDDLNKKIKQLTDLLGQENMADNLKGLFSMLASSMNKEESAPKANENDAPKEERSGGSELGDSIEMMRKVGKIMERLNTTTDPNINLLHAIKPFLNNKRQQKLDNCIKLLQVSRLTRLLDEGDKSKL